MLCFRYRKLLIPYSEGGLGAGVAARVERHLARCAACAAELEMIRSVARELGTADMPAKEPAADLWARVSARIADGAAHTAPGARLHAAGGLAAALAAAVLVAAVGMRLLAPQSPPAAKQRAIDHVVATATAPAAKPDKAQEPAPKPQPKPAPKPQPKPEPPAQEPRPYPGEHGWFVKRPVSPIRVASEKGVKPVIMATAPTTVARSPAEPAGNTRLFSYDAAKPEASNVSGSLSHGTSSDGGVSVALGVRATGGFSASAVRERPAPATTALPTTLGAARSPDHFFAAGDAPAAAPAGAEGGGLRLAPARAATAPGLWGDNIRAGTGVVAAPAATTSVVDDLNETEGVRTAAIFAYP